MVDVNTNQKISNRYLDNIFDECLQIRLFEEVLLDMFAKGKVAGTTHTCVGQELSGVLMGRSLRETDVVFSNHRCHGHFLGATKNFRGLAREIIGLGSGVNAGHAGSQHICLPGKFYSNGILGGMVPFAAGQSFASEDTNVTFCFLGDGSFGEGIIHEALTFANTFSCPILFIVEDNGIAQSTLTKSANKVDIELLFCAHGINVCKFENKDTFAFIEQFENLVSSVRSNGAPQAVIWKCDRHKAHSKGDDNRKLIDVQKMLDRDYLQNLAKSLSKSYQSEYKKAKFKMVKFFDEILNENVINDNIPGLINSQSPPKYTFETNSIDLTDSRFNSILNETLCCEVLEKGGTLIGEDIGGTYGGAFKVTKNLSEKFPDQVLNTSISEAGLVGFAGGMSTLGKPIVAEIMFGDFMTLCADQIINHISKFGLMHGDAGPNLVIRTPIGGGRGYGATHSQNLEKIFCGIPGVFIEHVSVFHDLTFLYREVSNRKGCTIISEPKLQYPKSRMAYNKPLADFWDIVSTKFTNGQEFVEFNPNFDTADITIVCTGIMLPEVLTAIHELLVEDEIIVEVVSPRLLYPFNETNYIDTLKCENILVIDEANNNFSFCDMISASLSRTKKVVKIDIGESIYPASLALEQQMMVTKQKIIKTVREIL